MQHIVLHLQQSFTALGEDGRDSVLNLYVPNNLREMNRHNQKQSTLLICPGGNALNMNACARGCDGVNATKMGYLAVGLLLQGESNRIVCTNNGLFTDVSIDEALEMNKQIQKKEVDVLTAMTGI